MVFGIFKYWELSTFSITSEEQPPSLKPDKKASNYNTQKSVDKDFINNNDKGNIPVVKSYPLAIDFTTTENQVSQERKIKTKKAPKVFSAKKSIAVSRKLGKLNSELSPPSLNSPVYIFYSTLTGTSEKIANLAIEKISLVLSNPPVLLNIDYIDDLDKYFVSPTIKDFHFPPIYLFIVPSYETESPLDYFIESLKETYNDFRVDSRTLSLIAGFSVFGIGDQESWPESSKYCYQGKIIDKWLSKLGAPRLFPLGMGCVKTNLDQEFDVWLQHLISTLKDEIVLSEPNSIADSDSESESESEDIESLESSSNATLVDVEDIGPSIEATANSRSQDSSLIKEMVGKSTPTFNALTKQGYTVVGSHSGVKICRWTKSALRGRGSCYKYSFYGIKSHLCMETTPSLACSSKCVFCWRHGTNPVGTTWRWQVDSPEVIFKGALEGHYKKIKQMKGVPGVVASRFAEAFQVRHCALSLVGEPIFYPYINDFVDLLHSQRISSFLVCNAQHPDELSRLKRVTQLYVSVDASNEENLKKVDRPLHRDFWTRFLKCLDILREKKEQRTVFRLTLVSGYNMSDYDEYAKLIARGEPCFVEIKGATFCGTSKTSSLTMKNIPFYQEVKDFVENLNAALGRLGLEYGIAAEHAHSCCILIAQNRFKVDGVWHTVIDYDKFFNLLEAGKDFGPMDYIAPTQSWAIYGSEEGGFSPNDLRFVKKK